MTIQLPLAIQELQGVQGGDGFQYLVKSLDNDPSSTTSLSPWFLIYVSSISLSVDTAKPGLVFWKQETRES